MGSTLLMRKGSIIVRMDIGLVDSLLTVAQPSVTVAVHI